MISAPPGARIAAFSAMAAAGVGPYPGNQSFDGTLLGLSTSEFQI
jgi:hypothetical protein